MSLADHYHVLPSADEITGRQLEDTALADVLKPMCVKFIERFYCRKSGILYAFFLRCVPSVIEFGFHQFQQEIRIALIRLKLLNYLRIFVYCSRCGVLKGILFFSTRLQSEFTLVSLLTECSYFSKNSL